MGPVQLLDHDDSHHLEAKSGRHRALTLRDRLPKSPTQTVRLLVGRVLLVPSLARLAVGLSLAAFVAADPLARGCGWNHRRQIRHGRLRGIAVIVAWEPLDRLDGQF